MTKTMLIALVAIFPFLCLAQVDTIDLSQGDLRVDQLREGLHQYLVYLHNPEDDKVFGTSIWNRRITFKDDLIEIEQYWNSSDTNFTRKVYSTCLRENFQPIFHQSEMTRVGIEAYNFFDDKIIGANAVADNTKQNFAVDLKTPTLNWELDLEIFSTLPYRTVGQIFMINFYHPGGRTAPQYYTYKVVEEDKIKGAGGISFDCWVLKIDYSEQNYAKFWIDKQSFDVIKMQEHYNGRYRYKVKLATPIE